MRFELKDQAEADAVTAEAVWLAYQASVPMGMGWMHERGGEKREDIVGSVEPGQSAHADYLAGRMVKLYIRRDAPNVLSVSDEVPHHDYQSWCGKYPTYEALLNAARESVGQ